jgi:hypothetical protein
MTWKHSSGSPSLIARVLPARDRCHQGTCRQSSR